MVVCLGQVSQSMMGFIECVLWIILLHVLSFGVSITYGGGYFGHFKVLVEVGFIRGFGNVVWSFDIFVHFDQKSFIIIFMFFIGIIMTLKIIYSKVPSQHFVF